MSESYQVISLQIPTAQSDFVQGVLYDFACRGLIEEELGSDQVRLKAYFLVDGNEGERLQAIQSQVPEAKCQESLIQLNASDFKPAPFEAIQLADDYWIVPPEDMRGESFRKPAGACVEIRPGMAFGTGRHETTQLCSEAILSLDRVPQSLLDVGTGSGVLAILAKRIGVKEVSAVEISEDARDNAMENFRLNEIKGIALFESLDDVTDSFDCVVANILTPTILNLNAHLLRCLKEGGRLILSGITGEEVPQIEQAFADLELIQRTDKDDWYCFTYLKS